jgi:hypothetical protein
VATLPCQCMLLYSITDAACIYPGAAGMAHAAFHAWFLRLHAPLCRIRQGACMLLSLLFHSPNDYAELCNNDRAAPSL